MKQRNVNFRQTRSERSASSSYGNFRKNLVKKLKIDSWKLKLTKYGKS
jgi:hypothetical protein